MRVLGDFLFELKHLENEIKRLVKTEIYEEFSSYFPPMDIIEGENSIKIFMDAPGMKPEDFKIFAENRHLIIKGIKRIDKTGAKGLNYLCLERKFGSFTRRIVLNGTPNLEKIKASLSKGVLTVVIPLVKAADSIVEIKVKGSEE